jgi:hypothetical protein
MAYFPVVPNKRDIAFMLLENVLLLRIHCRLTPKFHVGIEIRISPEALLVEHVTGVLISP